MPKAVLFDVDGTLIDPVDLHARAWRDVFRDCGHEIGFNEIRSRIDRAATTSRPCFVGSGN